MPKYKKKSSFDARAGGFPPQVVEVAQLLGDSFDLAKHERLQFVVPELILDILVINYGLEDIIKDAGGNTNSLKSDLLQYLNELDRVPGKADYNIETSENFSDLMLSVASICKRFRSRAIQPWHFLFAIASMEQTWACQVLRRCIPPSKFQQVLETFAQRTKKDSEQPFPPSFSDVIPNSDKSKHMPAGQYADNNDMRDLFAEEEEDDSPCQRLDLNKCLKRVPFVGREAELNKAVIALSKQNRGNVVFVGERGVGKSAMIVGLMQMMAKLKKTSRLGSCRFYELKPSELVSGTAYADEIENHLTEIICDIEDGPNRPRLNMAVLFIDNLGELMPMNNNDNTPDTLRLLISLMQNKDIHIVTTASFEQFKRLSTFNGVVNKHFTRIDINEPPLEPDCRKMVRAAADGIRSFHSCVVEDGVVDYVTDVANSQMAKEVAMPGRAIDLFDNLCSFNELECSRKSSKATPIIAKNHVEKLMAVLGFEGIANKADRENTLRSLEQNILARIYGQDEAVSGVAQSVLLAKAGLADESKPLAAYLFVGPTGVGKTELAKVLADELGTRLVRFDMSEYAEHHTVSKLVGSPAGYIGYDDGGLLTDAVRKTPNCVLLFDEIEKAHSAVFNLLLQVLDYAQLTDNKGQKADFSGTIIIMTSNAGARFATGNSLVFGSRMEKREVMGHELKKTFAPEFLNRLTKVVPFHDMSRDMAIRILDRKVAELQTKLTKNRNITFTLTPEAHELLLSKGFSAHYGAREMDRAIGQYLKPALMKAILFDNFGKGKLWVTVQNDALVASKSEPEQKVLAP